MRDILASAKDWTGGTWAERIDQCASMLFCHNYIPMSLRDKIGSKLEREIASAIEARRAATENTGAVHESAVAASETPKGEQP